MKERLKQTPLRSSPEEEDNCLCIFSDEEMAAGCRVDGGSAHICSR